MLAGRAVIVGSFQSERSDHALENLGFASGIARLLLAGAFCPRTLIVGVIGVQLFFQDPSDQSQGRSSSAVLQRLQVQARDTLPA